jgi:hypothetical protein
MIVSPAAQRRTLNLSLIVDKARQPAAVLTHQWTEQDAQRRIIQKPDLALCQALEPPVFNFRSIAQCLGHFASPAVSRTGCLYLLSIS